MGKKVLIVGGVAGGASAAARLRRLDEKVEIIVFERGKYISFANCGLPYHIGGIIDEREKLLLQTPRSMGRRFKLDIRTLHEVVRIDREKKEVDVRDLKNGWEYREVYDYLILSTGAKPFVPELKGIDREGIFTLRTIPDTDAIREFIERKKPRSAVVVGGGFIGIEVAENLKERGLEVTLVEMAPQVMPPLDFEMAAMLQQHLRSRGVNLILGQKVTGFPALKHHELDTSRCLNEDDYMVIDRDMIVVELERGKNILTDMVILALGVKPESQLARDAGLELGPGGAILVDEELRTSDPHIFAIGDAVCKKDLVSGDLTLIPLAGPANRQGRMVADIISGVKRKYKGVQGTSIVKVFDLVAASTGLNEKQLRQKGVDYLVSYTSSSSHAGYYPGSVSMTIKLIFTPEGKLLGAQIVGGEGVDKRIDVLATVLRSGGTVFDLEELELAYAPPFSSAKDPVNIAGYTAGNILERKMEVIHWYQVEGLTEEDYFILDVRDKVERQLGYISPSRHIPLDELRNRLDELPRDKTIVVYCQVGLRAYLACRILTQNGFRALNLSGGYRLYKPAVEEKKFGRCEPCEQWEAFKPRQYKIDMPGKEEKKDYKRPEKMNREKEVSLLDACGLQCPGPIMQVYKKMQNMDEGELLKVLATDPGFGNDIRAWCRSTGNTLLEQGREGDKLFALIVKGQRENGKETGNGRTDTSGKNDIQEVTEKSNRQTLVIFSGDLDKAIASFIIANGAASMGKKVTMFFTFWGLNILRKDRKVRTQKGLLERMFGWMMPRGSRKLGLSKMNMLGIGPRMIRFVMKRKNVDSLERLIEQARENGIKLVACQMSMDIMGIKKEELIDGVEAGGVASYLSEAEQANHNLFI